MIRQVMRGLVAMVLGVFLAGPLAAAERGIVMGAVLEPPHLDPTAGAAAAIDEVVYANVFEGLTRIDRDGVGPAGPGRESWQVSDDGLTYELHPALGGSTFHDGTTLEGRRRRLLAGPRPRRGQRQRPERPCSSPSPSVTAAKDNLTVAVITLKRPTGHFLFNLGWGDAVIVAPETR